MAAKQTLQDLIKGVTVSRMTVPNDANVYGNVHGGTTLKLIEEAGIILSTKFCNYAQQPDGKSPRLITTLARIESVDFMRPMKIGEVVELTAEIIYTSNHAILVEVTVDAEDIIAAFKQTTNLAKLWYVAWDEQEVMAIVPQMPTKSPKLANMAGSLTSVIKGDPTQPNLPISGIYNQDVRRLGSSIFVNAKDISMNVGHDDSQDSIGGIDVSDKSCACPANNNPLEHSPAFSETCLSMMIGVNDVAFGGNMCKGGVFMKLMDECAGIVAAKHCRTNVVTACMDATNFYSKIRRGHLLTIHGRATFTSSKSMEVEVEVWVDSPFNDGRKKRFISADAFFTYVSIGTNGRPKDIPQLVMTSDKEKESFENGKARYLKRKEHRQKTQ